MADPSALEDLLEEIAAAANHCEDRRLLSRLDRLYNRLENIERVARSAQIPPSGAHAPVTTKGALLPSDYVFQFRIELLGIEPPIWRRIQIPASSSLWDLHVAIQDAMGWLDSHLHAFSFLGTSVKLGTPLDGDPITIRPDWNHQVEEYLSYPSPLALYEYDFGDSWLHEVRFEEVSRAVARRKVPRCLAGARRCPPENCGGVNGYAEFLNVISDSTHPEHDRLIEWAGGPFDPEAFDPRKIRFSDPAKRLHDLIDP